jgi:ATP-dependent Zn protease
MTMDLWFKLFISWGPILLLIGVWIWFIKRSGSSRQAEYMKESVETSKRIEAALVRIADALEQAAMSKKHEGK